MGSKDRRFIADTVYGMTRWRLLLDYLIGSNPSWEKRLSLYQNFQPSEFASVNSIPAHIRFSCPKDLFDLLVKNYGERQGHYLAQINNTPAPITIRANPLKVSRQALLESLQPRFEVAPCSFAPHGIEFKKREPLTTLAEFEQGLFEIQDEASQLVSEKVKVKPGDQVLDFCSGAGGKSLAFAPAMKGQGQIYLHDIRPIVLQKAKKRFLRSGIQNVQFLTPEHPQLNKLKGKMDWVIADVPCSGTGTFRRNPDQKWKFSTADLKSLIPLQREIVTKALTFLKPQGKLVYATCSLLKAENEEQVAYFLEHLDLKPFEDPFFSLPSFGGMDGFFAFTFQKN